MDIRCVYAWLLFQGWAHLEKVHCELLMGESEGVWRLDDSVSGFCYRVDEVPAKDKVVQMLLW